MKEYAEFVSLGHPDRLCDRIVDSIVEYVVSKDKDALCGLECAIHTNKVFVDGRIAAGYKALVIDNEKIREIVKSVYETAGYNHITGYHPYSDELEIILDICIELLSDDERNLRSYSDDQNVVNGYAINNMKTNYLPIAHFLANKIGNYISKDASLGPDYKVLVQLEENNGKYSFDRITVSRQHKEEHTYRLIHKKIVKEIKEVLNELKLDGLEKIDEDKIYINGAGDFIQGGPYGDNGLSGKKLCLDFYGPSVPIGGGAISGKDPHKIDVCGAFRARELALNLVKNYNYYSVFVSLSWSPGEKTPHSVSAYSIDEFNTKIEIDRKLLPPTDWFSIDCINNDLHLDRLIRGKMIMNGYMFKFIYDSIH